MDKTKQIYEKPKVNEYGNIKELTSKITGPGDGPSLMEY